MICLPEGACVSQIPIKQVIKHGASLQSTPGHEELLTRRFQPTLARQEDEDAAGAATGM